MTENDKIRAEISEETLERYLSGFQTINRILTALSSSTNIEDLYGIILSALVSPHGLNFTRGVLFIYDPKFDTFSGSIALGPSTEAEAKEFREDLEAEEQALNHIMNNQKDRFDLLQNGGWESCISGLRISGLWINMVQRFGAESALTKSIQRLTFSGRGKHREEKYFHDICAKDYPLLQNKNDGTVFLPSMIAKIIDDEFIAVPIRSKTQRFAVVLVDRKFSNKRLGQEDLRHLQWFSNQASLVLENAVLYNNLQAAYRDLKELDTLKSNFLSTVSHELRTPLTTIYGFSGLLVEGKIGEVTDKQFNLLQRVNRNAAHLINLVNDIIEVAEIQVHGISDVSINEIDPLPIIKTAISNVQARKDGKVVDIQPVIDDEIPHILAEEHSLERIIYHLLDNAVKFSRDQGKILISFRKEEGDLRISVEDEGIGIDHENLTRIFESFYQVDNRLNRPFEGLGLGLSITRLLLAATGGKIQAESTLGKGSIFTILYPIFI